MVVPLQIAAVGLGIMFTLYLLFREKPKALTYERTPRPAYVYENNYDTNPNIMSGNNSNDCSICQEDINVGSAIKTLRCRHKFHDACISRWLVIERNCPICRKFA